MRYYSSNARETALTAAVTPTATTINVANPIGYPVNTPFEIHCELGTSNEEIMLVTATLGNAWTVQRGFDGSSALTHEIGAKIVHGVSAIDFREPQEHIEDSTGVHGIPAGASVVGTSGAQTLANKTLTTPTIGDFTNAQHTHTSAATGGPVSAGHPAPYAAFDTSQMTAIPVNTDKESPIVTVTSAPKPAGATRIGLIVSTYADIDLAPDGTIARLDVTLRLGAGFIPNQMQLASTSSATAYTFLWFLNDFASPTNCSIKAGYYGGPGGSTLWFGPAFMAGFWV